VNDHQHIDELIRRKFEGFEPVPPESVWDKVRAGIGPDAPPSRGGSISLPVITGLIILFGLVSLLWLVSRMETAIPIQTDNSPALSDNVTHFLVPDDDMLIADASYLAGKNNASLDNKNPSDHSLRGSSVPVRKPLDGSSPSADESKDRSSANSTPHIVKQGKKRLQDMPERFTTEAWRIEGKEFTGYIEQEGTNTATFRSRDNRFRLNDDYVAPTAPSWSVGLHFNPDVTFYPDDDISSGLSYSLQIMPKVKFNRWYMQSGIGLRTGGDRGSYEINYNKYLGSYEHVDDVTFDTTGNVVVPVYHTHTEDVYDTIPYYSISEAKVRYAYLDVPLLIGREWSFNRMSLFVHAGPSISVLLGRSSPQTDYPDEQIRILNESRQILARQQINWQLIAGAGFSYSFSDNVSLSLEPTLRYYLTKDFENDQLNSRHPYSIGIRAGFIFHINR
jgi:hypothetical protein